MNVANSAARKAGWAVEERHKPIGVSSVGVLKII
jgi:hypothetical protein